MPTTNLSQVLATYVASGNAHDIDAVATCCCEDAVVHDEAREHQGIAAVRRWARDLSAKYRPTVAMADIAETGGRTIVGARVAGGFAGDPVELRCAFTLRRANIACLEIS